MKKKAFEAIKIGFFISLGLLLAWLSLRNIPTDTLLENMLAVDPFWFAIALAIGILSHIIRALRWNMLLEPANYRVKPLHAIMAVLSGYFLNILLPRTGEIARCGLVVKTDKVPANVGIGTVVVERVVDMAFLMLFFGLSFFLGFGKLRDYISLKILNPLLEKVPLPILITVMVVGVIASGLFFLYFRRKSKKDTEKKGMVQGFMTGLKSITELKRPFAFIFSSFSIWGCYYLMLYVGFLAHPATRELGLEACLAVFVFGTVGMIVTPGGIGAYPTLVGQTLVLYGVEELSGASFGWIIWGGQTILIIVFGILSLMGFLFLITRSKTKIHDEGTITT